MKPRLFLLALLATGIALHFMSTYAAFHPGNLILFKFSYFPLCLVLLLLPITLWRMHGDRPLRIAVGGIWVSYIALWVVAIYQAMND